MEMWDHKMVFKIITWAAYGGIGASIVSTIGFIAARNTSGRVSLALLGITLSGAVIVVPYSYDKVLDRKAHPKIHDITTDTIIPPAFIAIIKERKDAKKLQRCKRNTTPISHFLNLSFLLIKYSRQRLN